MKSTAKNNALTLTAQQMIDLCVISYDDASKVPAEVRALGLVVVWGPAEADGIFNIPYSSMFVVGNPATNEFTVVIRGTRYDSIWSWLYEDFDVYYTEIFNQLDGNAPADARISQATFNGMHALLSLKDPRTGTSLVQFLQGSNMASLSVTGHSLGGTLTLPMAAYLKYQLIYSHPNLPISCASFAGLTPGNAAFATYFNSLFPSSRSLRCTNPLDIAPFLFYSQSGVEQIYEPVYPWSNLGLGYREIVNYLFYLASGNNYVQPGRNIQLPSVFNHAQSDWKKEAEYQHHVTTYKSLLYGMGK